MTVAFLPAVKMPLSVRDPTSFSRPDHHVIEHIHIVWNIDFENKKINGNVQLKIKIIDETVKDLILDVSDLLISKITSKNGEALNHHIDENIKDIGSKLTVQLPPSSKSCEITIEYETTSAASGLQWMEPLQTAGRKLPYLFSQFQAIHARSVMPCQDTPSVKFTYTSEVTAPSEFTVLMSALRSGKTEAVDNKSTSTFNQPVEIPAYLIAIAVGALESRKLGPRVSVWAEKEIVDKCAWEFSEAENMLKTAEDICGPYIWGIYDILVLPPSFPYGGMENPCISFITPTLLAGDHSLADVIVHEITHSWTGNLVTNRNFEHFWLNEGFTIFIERKISSRLSGDTKDNQKYRDFHTILGLEELRETVFENLGEKNPLTNLVVDLKGLNPDDAFSTVPYEKGSTFLRYLENLLGGPDAFEPFLRHYINTFQRKSIDTDDFKKILHEYFKGNDALAEIEWDKWLHTPGMPLHIPKYDASLFEACTQLAERWMTPGVDYTTFSMSDIEGMNSMQRKQFLTEIFKQDITLELVQALESSYKFSTTINAEIKCKWLRLCIKVKWSDKINTALQFVNDQGRMKFVRPIYRDLYHWEEARPLAVNNFNDNKKYMMHLSVYVIKKDLHLD